MRLNGHLLGRLSEGQCQHACSIFRRGRGRGRSRGCRAEGTRVEVLQRVHSYNSYQRETKTQARTLGEERFQGSSRVGKRGKHGARPSCEKVEFFSTEVPLIVIISVPSQRLNKYTLTNDITAPTFVFLAVGSSCLLNAILLLQLSTANTFKSSKLKVQLHLESFTE